jgi:hypothetical protein
MAGTSVPYPQNLAAIASLAPKEIEAAESVEWRQESPNTLIYKYVQLVRGCRGVRAVKKSYPAA